MSARRVTRAASSISRGPATPSEVTSTAPKRVSRRAGNQNLPAVATGRSTAYGDNTIAAPALSSAAPPQDSIEDVLNKLTGAPASSIAPSRRNPQPPASASLSRARTPPTSAPDTRSPPKNFADESSIFRDANCPSSNAASSSPAPVIPDAAQARLDDDRKIIEKIALKNLRTAQLERGIDTLSLKYRVSAATRQGFSWLNNVITTYWSTIFGLLLLPFVVYATYCIYQSMCTNGQNSVGSFPPQGDVTQYFQGELANIHQRLGSLEFDMKGIKITLGQLNSRTEEKLNNVLPDQLIFKKDKDGNVVFPDDFWTALRGELNSESSDEEFSEEEQKSKLSFKEAYLKYVSGNKRKLDAYTLHHFKKIFPNLLKENHIMSKQEVIESIKETWTEHKDSIGKDMNVLKQQLAIAKDDIKSSKTKQGYSYKELTTAVEEAVLNLISKGQIEALAKANLERPFSGPRQVNHLSAATGAVVHVKHTSPTFSFPEQEAWFPTRWRRSLRGNAVPQPNGPMTALKPWTEYGDSWCAPSPDQGGLPTSLTVILAHEVYPEFMIVEHLLSGSLMPGSAPMDMEAFAWIDDASKFDEVQQLSQNLLPESDIDTVPRGYVRIAEWRYNARSGQEVQRFPVQVDLKDADAPAKRVMIRAKNNWGKGETPVVCFYRVGLNGAVLNGPAPLMDG